MNQNPKILLAAISIAISFTFFACSSDENSGTITGACKASFPNIFGVGDDASYCMEFTADKQTISTGTQLTSKEFCEQGWLTVYCVQEGGDPECNPGDPGEYMNSCSDYALKCPGSYEFGASNIDNYVYYYGSFFEDKNCQDVKSFYETEIP